MRRSAPTQHAFLLLWIIVPLSIAIQTDLSTSIVIFDYEQFFQDVFIKEGEGM
jgi:hypothetical protein